MGVFQVGGCLCPLGGIVELPPEAIFPVATLMHGIGLGNLRAVAEEPKRTVDFQLQFDPALASALLRELREDSDSESTGRCR